jgi:hypothetical protein
VNPVVELIDVHEVPLSLLSFDKLTWGGSLDATGVLTYNDGFGASVAATLPSEVPYLMEFAV